MRSRIGIALLVAVFVTCASSTAAQADPAGLTRIMTDPFSNASSTHATAVEPDTFAFGDTLVASAQVGRFFDGGSSGFKYATSTNGGSSWSEGTLPNLTSQQNELLNYERVTDPSVAYDAKHDAWMISSLPIFADFDGHYGAEVAVSRSTDGGLTFGDPVTVAAVDRDFGQDFDKNWTVCDNYADSPYYGNCYTAWDDFGNDDAGLVSTSTDGGATWGSPATVPSSSVLGVQPVVQPDGDVVVPTRWGSSGTLNGARLTKMYSFRSTDGGQTWSSPAIVDTSRQYVSEHIVAGKLRDSNLPSAEVNAAGKVYMVWSDCRFRAKCASNDIVMTTSTDGVSWTKPKRVPIGSTRNGSDHFLPGIAVDPSSSGTTTKIGITSYEYKNAACGNKCALGARYIESGNGGKTWSSATKLIDPFKVKLVPNTSQGRMVGDYISTSWLGDKAFGAIAVGQAPTGGEDFDTAIYVPTGGLSASGTAKTGAASEAPSGSVAGFQAKPDRVR